MAKHHGLIWIFIVGVLIAVIGWGIFSMIQKGIRDLGSSMGITNFYVQTSLIIIIAIIALVGLGYSLKRVFKRIAR